MPPHLSRSLGGRDRGQQESEGEDIIPAPSLCASAPLRPLAARRDLRASFRRKEGNEFQLGQLNKTPQTLQVVRRHAERETPGYTLRGRGLVNFNLEVV